MFVLGSQHTMSKRERTVRLRVVDIGDGRASALTLDLPSWSGKTVSVGVIRHVPLDASLKLLRWRVRRICEQNIDTVPKQSIPVALRSFRFMVNGTAVKKACEPRFTLEDLLTDAALAFDVVDVHIASLNDSIMLTDHARVYEAAERLKLLNRIPDADHRYLMSDPTTTPGVKQLLVSVEETGGFDEARRDLHIRLREAVRAVGHARHVDAHTRLWGIRVAASSDSIEPLRPKYVAKCVEAGCKCCCEPNHAT